VRYEPDVVVWLIEVLSVAPAEDRVVATIVEEVPHEDVVVRGLVEPRIVVISASRLAYSGKLKPDIWYKLLKRDGTLLLPYYRQIGYLPVTGLTEPE